MKGQLPTPAIVRRDRASAPRVRVGAGGPRLRRALLGTLLALTGARSGPAATSVPYFQSIPSQRNGVIVSDPTIRPMERPGAPASVFASRPVDLQGNGRPDLVLCYGIVPPAPAQKMPMRILRPQPDGSLTDVTRALLGSGALPGGVAPAVILDGDFNKDGRTDLFVACGGWDAPPYPGEVNVLLLSQPDGTYRDASANLPQTPDFTHAAATGDVNGDGNLDLYVGNIFGEQRVGPYFLLGDGRGGFTKSDAGLPASIASRLETFNACALVDLDQDSRLDLVLGTANAPGYPDSIILFNDGTGNFAARPRLVLPAGPLGRSDTLAQGVGVLDVNRDGKPDLILSSSRVASFTGLGLQILINQGGGTVTDESTARLGSSSARLNGSPFPAPRFADFNRDGLTDFYFGNGPVEPFPRYFLANADGTFSPVPTSGTGALPLGMGFGVAGVHFDQDGAIDLVQFSHTSTGDVIYQSFLNRSSVVPVVTGFSGPVSREVSAGETVSVTVNATGSGPFTYQWRRNGVALAGQTSATLSLTAVQPGDAGSYTVTIAGAAGSVTSDPITVIVNTATSGPAPSVPPTVDTAAFIGRSPLKAPVNAAFTPGSFFTLEGWFYNTTPVPASGLVWIAGQSLAANSGDPYLGWGLFINANQRADFSYSTGAPGSYRSVASSNPIPLRTWTHLAAVMDGTVTRIYVNGALAGTATALGPVPAPGPVPLSLGVGITAQGSANYGEFNGYARQVRFWSVARTSAQIAAAMLEALPGDRSGLVAAWPLDEVAESPTLRDLSGANHVLTPALTPFQTVPVGLLAAGPFFESKTTPTAPGILQNADDQALIDFDADGDLDLVVIQVAPATVPGTPRRLRAFRNQQGSFVEATEAVLGDVTTIHVSQSLVADFNRDGRSDLFLATQGTDTAPFPGEQSRLLIQSSDGRLVDETGTRLPRRILFTRDAATADIDGDGDLDLYLGNLGSSTEAEGGPRFYRNNGTGVFTEATDRLPSDVASLGTAFFSCLLQDLDGDAFPDLVLGGGPGVPNEVLLNDRTGRFRRDSRYVLPAKLLGPTAVTVALAATDLDGDGTVDLLLSTTGGSNPNPGGRTITGYREPGLQWLRHRGGGQFVDESAGLGITWSPSNRWIKRLRPIDLNGDGRIDLVAPGNSGRWDFRLWLNRTGGGLVDVTSSVVAGATDTLIQTADVDRDGRLDLITTDANGVTLARSLKAMEFGRLANLSVRTQAGAGDATLIAGFVLGGAGAASATAAHAPAMPANASAAATGGVGAPRAMSAEAAGSPSASSAAAKSLLVRAVGPSLGAFGVTGTLADPALDLAPLGGARVAGNDDWAGAAALKNAFAAVGAFPLASDASRDAALVFTPAPGAYTATVSGGTGVALVEVYDAGTGLTPRLTNLSARTRAATGADVLIAGFVVSGTLPKRLLIRAAGPTLAAFGVGETLADPVLTLRPLGSETIVAANDDWGGTATLKAAFTAVGAFAFSGDASRDAAVVLDLAPGAYTAAVSGKAGTTGVALVEVYELP